MKRILPFTFLLITSVSFSQVVDVFDYDAPLNGNGWLSHSGTANDIITLTTPSDAGNSLAFPGLAASTGNRARLEAGDSEDVNKALTGISGTGYYSFLLKLTNTNSLMPNSGNGEHFIGFAATSGTTGVSAFGGRVYIKDGVTPGTFMLGVLNHTGGTVAPTYAPTEYAAGTTLFIVVKLDASVTPAVASMYINPTPGAAEPAATVTSSIGTTAFAAFAALYLRESGNITDGTGNLEIDEIRAGSDWASVTPSDSGCETQSTLNVTNCGPYTLNGETYNTTGVYTQVLEDANQAGCDSTITLNLTVVESITYYADTDEDGFGDAAVTQEACTQPAGYVTNDDDCDDTDDTIGLPTNQYFLDADEDGFGSNTVVTACTQPAGYVPNNWDCDDTDDQVGIATETYYADADNDGYGNVNASVIACTMPVGFVSDSTDCNDNDGDIHPNATDATGNGVDENCDGVDGNVGLGEFDAANMNVFPNPGSAVVNITVNGTWNNDVIVSILSIDGKQLQTAALSLENGSLSLSTAALQPSVYFIQVTDGARKATVRWAKH